MRHGTAVQHRTAGERALDVCGGHAVHRRRIQQIADRPGRTGTHGRASGASASAAASTAPASGFPFLPRYGNRPPGREVRIESEVLREKGTPARKVADIGRRRPRHGFVVEPEKSNARPFAP
jgi:hypothetical protein